MTSQRLCVLLDGQRVGTVEGADGSGSFVYSDRWPERGAAATPLSLSMPLRRRRHSLKTIETWLDGLLPDNADLLGHWQRATGAASTATFDLLATPMGLDCAGAVQVCPESRLDAALSRSGSLEPLSDADVARHLTAMRQRTHLARGVGAPGYFSLAGAQAKIALHRRDGSWHQPSGTAATTHILKPAVFMTQHQAVIEHLSMSAARRLGLPTATTEVTVFGGFDTIIVERYDRRRAGGRLLRLHQEDICQALGIKPALRYEQGGGPGLTQIVSLLRRHSTSPQADIADLLDAVAYQWIIGAPDGHAKNFSILIEGPEVRLAPMYDVCSVLPYVSPGETVEHALAIGGSHGVAPSAATEHWTRLARDIDTDAGALLARIRDMAAMVPDLLAQEAALMQDEFAASPRVGLLLNRVTARTQAILRR